MNVEGSRASLFNRTNREQYQTHFAPLDNLKTGGNTQSTLNLSVEKTPNHQRVKTANIG